MLNYYKQKKSEVSENTMGRGPVVPFLLDWMWPDEVVFMSD